MTKLTASTAITPSSPTGPIQSQLLFITQIVFQGKIYRVEACINDGSGAQLPFTAQYSQGALQQIQNYTQDLFTAHQLNLNSLSQNFLDIIGVGSQGLIKQDTSTISHDFLIEPLDAEMAARIASDVAPITPSTLKAQDIWNRLSSNILAPQTAASHPSTSPPVLATTSSVTPPANLTEPTDLLTHGVPSATSTPHPDPLLTPPIDSRGAATRDPVRTLPSIDDTAVLTDPRIPAHVQLGPTHFDQQVILPARPPRRTVLSTELQLKNHDFSTENWYETIPLRTRLRICQNILKARGIQPVERRVWDRFQEIYQRQASRDPRALTIGQLIQEEARRLHEQCRSQPSTLTRRQRNQGEHFLKRIAQNAPEEELNQWFRRYRVNDQFYHFFEEQIEAEGLVIDKSEGSACVKAHYTEDIPRFARVLERYLDSN